MAEITASMEAAPPGAVQVRLWHEHLIKPGSGRLVRVSAPAADPLSGGIVVVGQSFDTLDTLPASKLYKLDPGAGRLVRLTNGPGDELDPTFAPSGDCVAFRASHGRLDGYCAAIFDIETGEIDRAPFIAGSVEIIRWLPEGNTLLLVIANPGATLASTQGAVGGGKAVADAPLWSPSLDTGKDEPRRRLGLWTRGGVVRNISCGTNIWEAVSAGPHAAAVVGTDDAAEDAWYRAELRLIYLDSGDTRLLHRPARQIGALSASDDGTTIAFAEGLASDRGSLAGNLSLIDVATITVRQIDTLGVDVSWTGWDGQRCYAAGLRRDDNVVLLIDVTTGSAREIAVLHETNAGPRYPVLAPVPGSDALVAVLHAISHANQLVMIGSGTIRQLASLDTPESVAAVDANRPDRFSAFRWIASDGVEIDGWLHTPAGAGPFPLVMIVHGGPTARSTPKSIIDMGLGAALAAHGIAQFYPNPRGSIGRGQDYASAILHDMGGCDARDLLEGVDALIAAGVADPARLGVTGGSHGGFMTCWLITRDSRFRAAVAVAPITDWTSQRLTSNIPSFNDTFVGPPAGILPSPVLYADQVTTPILLIAGGRDRCTPPAQAEHFHRALQLAGKPSTLLIYPLEEHGIRALPASIDHIGRIVDFFDLHLKAMM